MVTPELLAAGEQGVELGDGGHGVGAGEPRGDQRAGGVGVLRAAGRLPAGEQPVHQRAAEGVAGAEAADDLDRVRRDDGGAVGRGDQHALAAHLHQGELDAAVEQPVARPRAGRWCRPPPRPRPGCRRSRSRGRASRRTRRAPPRARARTSRASRGRGSSSGPTRAAGAAGGRASRAGCVRAGSTLTPVPVTQSTGTSATTSHGTSSGGEREVGRDRRAVEGERRVLRRVQLAEDHRGLQPGRGADVRRVHAEAGQRLAHVVAEAVRARPW